eukprot:m51a1_g7526 putative C-tail anchored protein, N-terminal Syntaxin and C-terminal SNARE domain (251) ;mRNA; r:31146-32302
MAAPTFQAQDPFNVVRSEVEQNLEAMMAQYQQWTRMLESGSDSQDFAALGKEITGKAANIEYDLQDLEETVRIVEQNRAKFKIETAEIDNRKRFITQTRESLQRVRAEIENPESRDKAHANSRSLLMKKREPGKFTKLDEYIEESNQQFLEGQQQAQAQIIEHQDGKLDQLSHTIVQIGEMGNVMADELDAQGRLLGDLDHKVETTNSRLVVTKKRLDKLLEQTKAKGSYILIGILIVLLILVVLAAVYL